MKTYREQYLGEMDRILDEMRSINEDFKRIIALNDEILGPSLARPERFTDSCEPGIVRK